MTKLVGINRSIYLSIFLSIYLSIYLFIYTTLLAGNGSHLFWTTPSEGTLRRPSSRPRPGQQKCAVRRHPVTASKPHRHASEQRRTTTRCKDHQASPHQNTQPVTLRRQALCQEHLAERARDDTQQGTERRATRQCPSILHT